MTIALEGIDFAKTTARCCVTLRFHDKQKATPEFASEFFTDTSRKRMSESAAPNAAVPKRPSPADEVEALPVGTSLSEFRIDGVLGRGGFGIVYLALDVSLQRRVAIKEYLPAALALRRPDGYLAVRSAAFAESYEMGLRSFVNESRLLARFDHPALVKVHRFWEANGTAYMVMPYYQGATLTQVRQSMIGPPAQAWVRRILNDLLGALDVMHAASVFHRDVAPDNIVLLPSGSPVLLDFGAARHVLEDGAQSITSLVKPAYAPIEQYAAGSQFRQGPWTDIYGASATLHYCLTGNPPPTAAARIVQDDYEPLNHRKELLEPESGEPYGRDWLTALDWGLEIKPQDRPQSIAQWRKALESRPGPVKIPRERQSSAAAPVLPIMPTPATMVAGDAFAPTRADRPVSVVSALMARAVAAPRIVSWGAAAAVLMALGAGAWDDLAPTASGNAPIVATAPVAPVALAEPGSAGTASTTPAALASPVAQTRALPAVHTPKASNEDVPTDRSLDVSAGTNEAVASPAPSKRKLKVVKARPAPHNKELRLVEATRVGPQIVEARRDPAWVHAGEPTPRDVCSGRGFLGSLNCMRDTCASAKWAKHAQCLHWQRLERRHMANL
jgi:serine/threonine protein kinase